MACPRRPISATLPLAQRSPKPAYDSLDKLAYDIVGLWSPSAQSRILPLGHHVSARRLYHVAPLSPISEILIARPRAAKLRPATPRIISRSKHCRIGFGCISISCFHNSILSLLQIHILARDASEEHLIHDIHAVIWLFDHPYLLDASLWQNRREDMQSVVTQRDYRTAVPSAQIGV